MNNIDETVTEILKYLKKLDSALQTDIVFNLGNTKLVKKSRIDDLLCCLEASLPKEFKNYKPKIGQKILQSLTIWHQLNDEIKNVFKLNKNLYSINVHDATKMIQILEKTIASDINKVYRENCD